MTAGAEFRDYEISKDRIALWPRNKRRGESKLLVATRQRTGSSITDSSFSRIIEYLTSGDLLIVNTSRVEPCRAYFSHTGSGREVEFFFLAAVGANRWRAYVRGGGRYTTADSFSLGPLVAKICGRGESVKEFLVEVSSSEISDTESKRITEILRAHSVMPIPPYIRDGRAVAEDQKYYQTVYAATPGSVAAPTAGLHFTDNLLATLKSRGVEILNIVLHLSAYSMQDLEVENEANPTATEHYMITEQVWQQIQAKKSKQQRIIAVGTSVTRALESFALLDSATRETSFNRLLKTTLYITPGFRFQVIDALLTNFHLPRSTHLSLVNAFYGADRIQQIYTHALTGDYMFYSYGDSMLLS
ncbi:tRNA preQ1(34) S-adenosylmethionine ribosyltransferase-isomerase QueA [bacterium]|nr:tRNA preQ1(34) S-adenosylmethionine ribosyltransferase-isomerase QueA [bacterium]